MSRSSRGRFGQNPRPEWNLEHYHRKGAQEMFSESEPLPQVLDLVDQVKGLSLKEAHGGLPCIHVATGACQGEVYLHGAHVTAFQPAGQEPVLWLSGSSRFSTGQPIRGGIPICFPWFGPHASDPQAPAHGLARLHAWSLTQTQQHAHQALSLTFEADLDGWAARFEVTFAASLKVALTVTLPAQAVAARRFEAALHTYLNVADARQIVIRGLESAPFIDKVDGGQRKPASGKPIQLGEECDRVYLDTRATCLVQDPVLGRELEVSKSGSRNTVVWNPWVAKSARMPDFGDDEWTGMVCVESANVGEAAVELQPGQTHSLQAEIVSRPL